MRKRIVRSTYLVLIATFTVSTSADVLVLGRAYSSGAGSNESSSSAHANVSQPVEDQSIKWTERYPALQRQAFDIGPEVYHFKYEEPGIMEEEGFFYGFRFRFTEREWVPTSQQANPPENGRMIRAEARFAYGQVDYDGRLMNGTPYTIDDIDDWALEGRFLLGGDWLTQSALNTFYAGVGYRYLLDKASSDPFGYDRESNYLHVPVGFQFDSSNELGWSLGFNAEFDVFIVGVQRSHLSDVGLTDVENVQDSGYGYRASVRLQHKSEDEIFVIEPFFRYWDIDRSEIEYEIFGAFFEPANESIEVGISAIWMF